VRRRVLPGKFSRGFDSPMFADANVMAETFNEDWSDHIEWKL